MTESYDIPDIDIGPSPIELPPSPPAVHMSEPQPSTSAPAPQMSNDEVLAQAMKIMDYNDYEFHKKGSNCSQHTGPVENTAVMIRNDPKGKSLLKEPPVFNGDKKKY